MNNMVNIFLFGKTSFTEMINLNFDIVVEDF